MSDIDAAAPRAEALAWWKGRIEAERYAGGRDELPSAVAVRYLRAGGLLAETPGGWGWVVLAGPSADADAALRQNYWALVQVLLARYAPAAVERISAVRLHLGEAHLLPSLYAAQGTNASKRTVEIAPGLAAEIRPAAGPLAPEQVIEVTTGGGLIPVLSPGRTLLSLTVGDVRDNRDLLLSWLRSLVLAKPELEAAYAAAPRHVLLARIGHLASEIGNRRLATQIAELLAAEHRNPVSRTHTRVGSEIEIPRYIISQPSLREPWADRFRARLARAAEVAQPLVAAAESQVAQLSVNDVLAQARSAKLEDTYHSTTIEGYRITRDDIRAVEEGTPYKGKSPEEIERIMALKGYSQAFERTLELIRDRERGDVRITEGDILDLNLELWGPSIDAGTLRASDLRGWRRDPVYIRRSDHVPPAPGKLTTLMRVLVDDLSTLDAGPITRATVAHWGFVHLHPFMDGNGRVSRLLMNLFLGTGGVAWTTIRAEERDRYFAALERAHIQEDYAPFAEFVRDCVLRAAGSLTEALAP